MKSRRLCKMICAIMLGLCISGALVGCGLKKDETVTVYPCYFNRDVEGMDAATIREALEQAGWQLINTRPSAADESTVYAYQTEEYFAQGTKGLSIYEYASEEQAAQAYARDYLQGSVVGGNFSINTYPYHMMAIRISNCCIWALNDAHVDLVEMLGLGTIEPLKVTTEHTYEMCSDCNSVDIETVKTAMEADGYQFYDAEFWVDEEQDSHTYLIVSPEQDRKYVYTRGEKPKFGVPSAYRTFDQLEQWAESSDMTDADLGIHFVGFKDGSCILCYGDSFEEIEGYFAN